MAFLTASTIWYNRKALAREIRAVEDIFNRNEGGEFDEYIVYMHKATYDSSSLSFLGKLFALYEPHIWLVAFTSITVMIYTARKSEIHILNNIEYDRLIMEDKQRQEASKLQDEITNLQREVYRLELQQLRVLDRKKPQ